MKQILLFLILLLTVTSSIQAAEYTLTWSPVTTYADGRPIPADTTVFYRVYDENGLYNIVVDTLCDVSTPDDNWAHFIIRVYVCMHPPSPPSPELSGRTVRVLPGFGRVFTSIYPEPLHLVAVKHPHPLDSLRIDDQGIYWWSYLDLNRDKWINLSDLGLFAVRFVAAHFSPGWGMYRIGGDLGPADLIVMGEIMNGSAERMVE